jgi:hypothetical protein
MPSEINLVEKTIQKESKEYKRASRFFWYFENEKSGTKYEKIEHSIIAEKYFLNKNFLKK